MSKLIFGCGYLGRRVARLWHAGGEQVFVVTRDAGHARQFEQAGYTPIVADVTRSDDLGKLPAADAVLYAVGHDRRSGAAMRELVVNGLRSVLEALPADTGKFIYISSTGVYGQSQGERVDEESPCAPVRAGGRACLEAEQALSAHSLGRRAVILRMAGLYGPGRIPNVDDIRQNRPIAAPEHGWLNLIHVNDAAAVVVAAERRAVPPRTYVVSDGSPVERRAYYEELARLLAAPAPRFVAADPSSPAAARAASDKRVGNARMLAELEIQLQYPSYRDALAAIVAAEVDESAGL